MDYYNYLKSLHLIFVITWFAGLFYIVRLFVYQIEANDKPSPEKEILQNADPVPSYGDGKPYATIPIKSTSAAK